jgi:hypothetical protein
MPSRMTGDAEGPSSGRTDAASPLERGLRNQAPDLAFVAKSAPAEEFVAAVLKACFPL